MMIGDRFGYLLRILVVSFLFCIMMPVNLEAADKLGSPLINNYYPHQYKANSQNWSAVEDHRGIMYFANIDGVLEYDGSRWNLISLPDNKPVTSLASGLDGVIYVGSNSEFGFLTPDKNGRLVYESLLHLFPEDEQEFPFIWKIAVTSQGVFFNNYDNFYHLKDDEIKVFKTERFSHFFKVNDQIYVFDVNPEKGLKYFDGKTLVSFGKENSLTDYYIMEMHPYSEDKIFAICYFNGFLLINDILNKSDKSLFEPEPLESQEVYSLIMEKDVINSIKLLNGNYAFATLSDGVYIMNRDGSLNRIINKSTGLQNQTVNNLYESKGYVLWLVLDNGISSVNLNYPVTFWDETSGYEGSILDVIRFKNDIYISTWQGVYQLASVDKNGLSKAAGSTFEKVEGISARAWSFLIFEDSKNDEEKLLAATSRGLYEVIGNKSKEIAGGIFLSVETASQNENIVLCGFGQGFALMHYDQRNRSFRLLKYLAELSDYEIVRIQEDDPGYFWLSHRSGGISAVKFNNLENIAKATDEINYEIIHFGSDHGIPDNIELFTLKTKKKILFYSINSFYFFKKHNADSIALGEFLPVSDIVNDYIKRNWTVTKIRIDDFGNCWVQFFSLNTRERRLFLIKNFEDNKLRLSEYQMLPVRQTGVNRAMAEKDGSIVWIGSDDALFRLNLDILSFERNDQISPLIRNVRVNNRSIYGGADTKTQFFYKENTDIIYNAFKHNENSFSFDYACPDFFHLTDNLYSVYLQNYDKDWSGWAYETNKTYNNIPPGDYIFLVQSMDAFGNKSQVSGYPFTVLNPWYKTQPAFVIYLISAVLMVYLLIKIANHQLVKAKTNLEKIVRERTSEIASQRKKIEIEKEKADKLLCNILPFNVAQELKSYGTVRAQYYDMATVMFMDFKDFSKTSQFINPLHLLSELDNSFGYFDEVCARHNMEKIKTMGDAYMCVGGIPQTNKSNPFDAILAAFEILEFVKKAEKNQWLCELRIGIHTGDLIAGIIGKNKFAYDVWGETVNTASRLETTGEINKINISGETYSIVKDYFLCTYRGRLPAKHSDEYQMYFINRIRKEYSADNAGYKPNKEFIDIILNMK